MPVVDTEVLFGLNPKDKRHHDTLSRLQELLSRHKKIFAPDTALFEFQTVLRSIDREPKVMRIIILGLRKALEINAVEEAKTIDSGLLAKQSEIEERYALSYFDSLIAASALSVDGEIISSDPAFDSVPGLKRTTLGMVSSSSHLK